MAGHSKWANIRYRKGAQDQQKAKINTQRLREVTIATREGGGGDANANPRLRMAIQAAKGDNIAKDKIEKAIEKGLGQRSGIAQKVRYEAYAPHGIAFFLEGLTDNVNRTVAEVRALLNKHGGRLEKNGAVAHFFTHKALFNIEKANVPDEEILTLALIESGAEEIEQEGDMLQISAPAIKFGPLQTALEKQGIPIKESALYYIAKNYIVLPSEIADKVWKLIEKFEELDDIEQVVHNLAFPSDLKR